VAAASAGINPAQHSSKGLATYATGIVYGLQPDALFVVRAGLVRMSVRSACTSFCVSTFPLVCPLALRMPASSASRQTKAVFVDMHADQHLVRLVL